MKNNNKGFSLVELIVVIAIMAILAAVAVVGFSVFIPKAQEQADNSTLDMLSDSFMAACLSAGVDHREVAASFAIDENGNLKQDTLELGGSLTEEQESEIETMLLATITGEKISFHMPNGARKFIATVEGRFAFADKAVNGKVTVGNFSALLEDIDAFNNSAFGNIGTDVLLDNVNSIIDQVSGIDPLKVEGFEEFYLAMGGDPTNKDDMMNALVLYTAYVSNGQASDEEYKENMGNYILGNSSSIDKTVSGTDNITDDFLMAEAMKYAVGMAWIREFQALVKLENEHYYLDCDGEKISPEDYDQVTSAMNKTISVKSQFDDPVPGELQSHAYTTFEGWYNTNENGKNAVSGYLAAMGMIDDNRGEIGIVDDYSDYAEVIDQLLGNN